MALHLTEEQIVEFRESFSSVDKANSNKIHTNELNAVMKHLGQDLSANELKDLTHECDPKGTGSVDFDMFLGAMSRILKESENAEEVVNSFKILDKDGKGVVSSAELKQVIQSLNEKLSPSDVEELIKEADPKHEGKIAYADFVKQLSK